MHVSPRQSINIIPAASLRILLSSLEAFPLSAFIFPGT